MNQKIKPDQLIGQNIRRLRTDKRWTQEKLAIELQKIGCDMSRGTLAKIEAGIRHISRFELHSLMRVLKASYQDILE